MNRKKRVLWVSESSYLNTGFSVYSHEILTRLHATGKYELGELASYAPHGDPRRGAIPWWFLSAMPDPHNQDECRAYDSVPTNQFGEWKFEEACLRFRPDVVCTIRDAWHDAFVQSSPLRPFYRWVHMATVDAEPQAPEWLYMFSDADVLLTYSDWAQGLLRKQGGGHINLGGSTPAGADSAFRPVKDRRAHKAAFGLDPECYIIGTTMRNQKRKLFPDLILAFSRFLKKAPPGLAGKTFLYLHTAWPDLGWNIPGLLAENGVSSKTLMTYRCRACGAAFPAFFSGARAACRGCGEHSASLANSDHGVSRDTLAAVMNCFDAHVQLANSEGQGLPQVEAAACGVPVFSTDYSAMSDVVRKVNGTPIKVKALVRESETHCLRAVPDNDDLVDKLIAHFLLPDQVRGRKGREAREGVDKHYSYDKSAKTWEGHIDSLPWASSWDSPPRLHRPSDECPGNLSDEEFVRWGFANVAGRPEMADSYTAMKMARDLHWGVTAPHTGGVYFNECSMLGAQQRLQSFDREAAYREMLNLGEKKNYWERKRCGL